MIVIFTEFSLNLQQELALFIKLPNKNYSYETDFEPLEKGRH